MRSGCAASAPSGEVVGVRLFFGLFTSLAYSRNPRSIPLLRLKVRRIVERAGLAPASHDGKALLHILDTLPRDELFQTDEDQLFDTVIGILNLQERQRIALFIRRDPLERFVSCLVYVPRERYDTALRRRFAAILEEAFAGELSTFYTHLDDSPLARVHFIIRTTRGACRLSTPPRSKSGSPRPGAAGRTGSRKRRRRPSAKRRRVPGCAACSPFRSLIRRGRKPPRRSPICAGSRRCWRVRRSKSRCTRSPMAVSRDCASIGPKSR